MNPTLHSLSVYEEIVAHNNLKMMTKLTEAPYVGTENWRNAGKEQDLAFRKAHASRLEVLTLENKKGKVPASKLYPPDLD